MASYGLFIDQATSNTIDSYTFGLFGTVSGIIIYSGLVTWIGGLQLIANIMRAILVNFVDQPTFDPTNLFLSVMFYWVPTVLTYA